MHARVFTLSLLILFSSSASSMIAERMIREVVYVETPVDTDGDGRNDRIYVEVDRPTSSEKLPAIYTISPYALGGNSARFHNVDVKDLPQGASIAFNGKDSNSNPSHLSHKGEFEFQSEALARGYASLSAHSLGTGYSSGCPTVGGDAETLAAKSVIDWLNGRARAFTKDGREVKASWANGAVGMTGVSYNGTLPNMVATTGVDGLKAIVPVAAISNWYDYYRANGLVVGPGGYVGEDADVLGKFIVRRGACQAQMDRLTRAIGREHGDFTEFWQDRDYVAKAGNVRAAVFIMHGQSDWNVRQRHAIQWWNRLDNNVPRRMWLHRGGHSHPNRADVQEQIWAWFDQYVKGVSNNVNDEPVIEVENPRGGWTKQDTWPSERTSSKLFYLNANSTLSESPGDEAKLVFTDRGRQNRLEVLVDKPLQRHDARLAFVTEPYPSPRLMSGTAKISLQMAVKNRRAANITVVVVDYDSNGRGTVVTRGWADPQNYNSLDRGELLEPGQEISLEFELEPKQYQFPAGHRLGVIVTATDYDHTLRPDPGTEIEVSLGHQSHIELWMD